jgi:trehalose 6-phosphate synthase/phosphatase
MSRLIIVSNRLPVTVTQKGDHFEYQYSVGGVATGIASLEKPAQRLWFGWPGLASEGLTAENKTAISEGLLDYGSSPVFLSEQDIEDFYLGFSNKTIWPLFHYFTRYTNFEESYWDAYKKVNQAFCDAIVEQAQPDDQIWIHDYQLLLLPLMIREKLPKVQIGYFHHIPFPTFELIRLLPWRVELLEGMLGADLIGFHEYDYVRHFLSSVYRISGYEPHFNELLVKDRLVEVDAFPMGIDYDKFAKSSTLPAVQDEVRKLKNLNNARVIISVDRLDYTKGILNRLQAYDAFLTKYPQYREKVTLVMVAVPSRADVDVYEHLREDIERTVGRINGAYGTLDWTPISYMYRSLPFEQLAALYSLADMALITPLRDGMNLVAKEFVACQQDKDHQGILILSEMAGAASELSEAIVINPHDTKAIVKAIVKGLEMPQDERYERNQFLQKRLQRYTVGRWAGDFIDSLDDLKDRQQNLRTRKMTSEIAEEIGHAYNSAEKRLIFLDYDGTLTPFFKNPADAYPNEELVAMLTTLTEDKHNEVVLISGRDRHTLSKWMGHLDVNMVSEHGAYVRDRGCEWKSTINTDPQWKQVIRPILELSVDRTPGSFIEEKNFSLVWHCRRSEPDLAKLRTQELKDALMAMTTNLNIGVFEGNKIVEIKPLEVNKGIAAQNWLNRDDYSFVMVAGDDYTDEDMFGVMPETAYSCKIGHGLSKAKYRLNSVQAFRRFLKHLINHEQK